MVELPRVLFLCTANSCRSQMAEGWLRALASDRFESLSAGTRASSVNPRAVAVMAEIGIELGGQRSKAIEEFVDRPPDVVVTVCDRAASACPVFPGATRVLHWPFPDPADAGGTEEQVLFEFRAVRDAIGARLRAWLAAPGEDLS